MGELENKMTAERSGQMSNAELRWRLLKVETRNVLRGIGERLRENPKSFFAPLMILSGGLAGPIEVIAQSNDAVVREVPIEAQSTKEVEAIVTMADEARQAWAVEEITGTRKVGARMDGSAEKATPVASQERDESELEDFRLIQIDPDEWREAAKVVYRSSSEEWQALGTSFEKEAEKLSRWGRGPLGGSPLPSKGAMLATDNMVELLKRRGITIEDCSDKFRLVAIREGEKASQAAIRCGYTPSSLAFFNGALNSSHLDRSDVGVLIVPNLPQWEIKTGFGGPVLKAAEVLAGVEETMRREFNEGGHQVVELSAVANGGDEAIPVMVIDSRLIRRVNPEGKQISLKRVDGEVHAGVVGGTLWKIEVKRMESVTVYMENDIPIKDPVAKVSNRNGNPVRWVNLITGEEGKWGEWPPVTVITPEPTVVLREAPDLSGYGLKWNGEYYKTIDTRWDLPVDTKAGRVVSMEMVESEKSLGLVLHPNVVEQLFLEANSSEALAENKWQIPLPFDPGNMQVEVCEVVNNRSGNCSIQIKFQGELPVSINIVSPYPGATLTKSYSSKGFDGVHLNKINWFVPEEFNPARDEDALLLGVYYQTGEPAVDNSGRKLSYGEVAVVIDPSDDLPAPPANSSGVGLALLVGAKSGAGNIKQENILAVDGVPVFMMGK